MVDHLCRGIDLLLLKCGSNEWKTAKGTKDSFNNEPDKTTVNKRMSREML